MSRRRGRSPKVETVRPVPAPVRSRKPRRLRDRISQRGVAAAITSPAGIAIGSVAAAILLALGAHPAASALAGLAAYAVPVARAMNDPGRRTSAPMPAHAPTLDGVWASGVSEAHDALARYRRALDRCSSGPLVERLAALEEEVVELVAGCEEIAGWGVEAVSARLELDPAAMERVAKRAGVAGDRVASDQRALLGQLELVEADLEARLTLINGRLDEVVGTVVQLAAKDARQSDHVADDVASEVRALRDALHEVDQHDHPHRRSTSQLQRGATADG